MEDVDLVVKLRRMVGAPLVLPMPLFTSGSANALT